MARDRDELTIFRVHRNVVVLGLTSTVATFGNTLWIFFFPLVLQGEGLSPFWIGIVYSLNALVGALIEVPVGALIDRYGRKPAVVTGTLIFIAMPLSLALSSIPLVSVCAFVTALPLGGVLFSLGYWAMISDSAAGNPATSFGAFITMAGWASIFAPSIGGLLLEINRRTVFLLAFLLGLAAAAGRAIYLKETLHGGRSREPIDRRKLSVFGDLKRKVAVVAANRLLLLITLAYTVYNLFLTQVSFIVPLYSVEVLKLNTAEVGLLFSVFMLVNSQLAVPFGMLADRAGYSRVILASWISEMTLMMVFAYSIGSLMVMLSFSSWVAFGSMDAPAIQAWLGKMTRQETRATSLGLFSTIRDLASVPSVAVAGVLYSLSPRLPFWSNLAASSVALSIFLRFVRSQQAAPRDERAHTSQRVSHQTPLNDEDQGITRAAYDSAALSGLVRNNEEVQSQVQALLQQRHGRAGMTSLSLQRTEGFLPRPYQMPRNAQKLLGL